MTDADGTFQLPMPPQVQAPTVLGEAAAVRLGDAYDLMESLDSSSVDLLITSPPYWGHRSYGREHNWKIHEEWQRAGGTVETPPPYEWYRKAGGVLGLEPFPDWYVAHLVEIFERARPRLKGTASVWVNVGDTYFARWSSIRESGRQGLGDNARVRRRTPMGDYRQEKQLLMIPARFAIAMQARRWILRNDVIWFKPNVPPRPEADRLRLSHEHFFHFVLRPKEGRAKYHYDLAAVEPRAHDVIEVPVRAGQDGHSATFPADLIRPRILSSCPPGGLVLDPFCGTGRALAVAVQNGRRAIGFDVSPEFAKAARGTAGGTVAPAKGNARARRAIVKPGTPGGRIRKSNGAR
ncbi:site-specific DNA-methyltransferase [Hyphomicrobium sp.]|uniref:DNA-methyltransferase n=1 Tax=Hyphomicrobium sp. TaxID=82 RepID=UPI0025C196EC|nr:site-specific DNA-methyltransferase [Hyphomicrobium sp.]MCC7251201.1 site-specific DNA-methyltransferase [Hyphomicrobium sp.]